MTKKIRTVKKDQARSDRGKTRITRKRQYGKIQPVEPQSSLSSDFDALLARMQSSDFCCAMAAVFRASPKQLGKAAVAAARNRG